MTVLQTVDMDAIDLEVQDEVDQMEIEYQNEVNARLNQAGQTMAALSSTPEEIAQAQQLYPSAFAQIRANVARMKAKVSGGVP